MGITLRLEEAGPESAGGSQDAIYLELELFRKFETPRAWEATLGGHRAGSGGLPPGASVAALGGWPSTTARKEMWE